MKKLFALLMVLSLCVLPGTGMTTGIADESEITALLNGRKIEFEVAPIIENGRTLVPFRAIFEALGMEVSYENGEVSAEKEAMAIKLTIDSSIAYVNGEQKTIDVPARIVNDTTLVPLRFIGEAMGLVVGYNSETRTATLNDLSAMTLTPKNHDLKSDWDDGTATKINLNGSSATVEGAGAAAEGGTITISEAGVFVVSGTLSDGQIVVSATNQDRVHLIFNGADITNKTGAAVYAPQCDKLILTLAEGTVNSLTDGGENFVYALSDDKEPNAALFVKDDLTINGRGTLTVNAGFNNGIGTKDDLLIVDGGLIINAANHGMRGNDSVGIISGSFDITAGDDAIQTNNETDEGLGWIIIEGGSFDIKAQNDGIQADKELSITGGIFNITAGGGSANAPQRAQERGGFGGARQTQVQQTTVAETAETTEATDKKAIKAGTQLNIMGGEFTIDSEDDGIHSNGDIFIASGKISVKTGDDGIHADNEVIITGGKIDIPVCYEGIEGLSVTIRDGDILIVASDDAINAAGGTSGARGAMGGGQMTGGGQMAGGGQMGMMNPTDMEAMQKAMEIIRAAGANELSEEQLQELYDLGLTDEQITRFKSMTQGGRGNTMSPDTRNPEQMTRMPEDGTAMPSGERTADMQRQQGGQGMQGGGMNEPRFGAVSGAFVRICGGTIDIWGRTDGIDSNGDVYLEGGTIMINGQSSGAEGALEMDGNFIVTGGKLITAGSVYSPSASSTQPVILLSYANGQVAGDVIAVKDANGNTLLEYTSKVSFTASGFTSPLFKTGATYSVFINGEKRIDITLSGLTTSTRDDGGAYSTGRGAMGGGRAGAMGGQQAANGALPGGGQQNATQGQ